MAKRKANPGSFRPGADPRRHTFTTAERRRGHATALEKTKRDWHLHAWFLRMIRSYYRHH